MNSYVVELFIDLSPKDWLGYMTVKTYPLLMMLISWVVSERNLVWTLKHILLSPKSENTTELEFLGEIADYVFNTYPNDSNI